MNEANNTFRLLQDAPTLITRVMCYVGVHKWTMYTQPIDEVRGVYTHRIQQRYCAGCGLYSEKILWKHLR
jgi:hypothetical protein